MRVRMSASIHLESSLQQNNVAEYETIFRGEVTEAVHFNLKYFCFLCLLFWLLKEDFRTGRSFLSRHLLAPLNEKGYHGAWKISKGKTVA